MCLLYFCTLALSVQMTAQLYSFMLMGSRGRAVFLHHTDKEVHSHTGCRGHGWKGDYGRKSLWLVGRGHGSWVPRKSYRHTVQLHCMQYLWTTSRGTQINHRSMDQLLRFTWSFTTRKKSKWLDNWLFHMSWMYSHITLWFGICTQLKTHIERKYMLTNTGNPNTFFLSRFW